MVSNMPIPNRVAKTTLTGVQMAKALTRTCSIPLEPSSLGDSSSSRPVWSNVTSQVLGSCIACNLLNMDTSLQWQWGACFVLHSGEQSQTTIRALNSTTKSNVVGGVKHTYSVQQGQDRGSKRQITIDY